MNTIIKPFDKLTTQELFNIYKLRVDVFVVEQQCPYHEVDDIDTISHQTQRIRHTNNENGN